MASKRAMWAAGKNHEGLLLDARRKGKTITALANSLDAEPAYLERLLSGLRRSGQVRCTSRRARKLQASAAAGTHFDKQRAQVPGSPGRHGVRGASRMSLYRDDAKRWLREALHELERQTWDDECETFTPGGDMAEARRAVERALDNLRRLAPNV